MNRSLEIAGRPSDGPDPEEWLPRVALMFNRAAGQHTQYVTPQYFTLKQASVYMGLSERFLRRLIAAGKLQSLRDGRIKVRRVDLDSLPEPAELVKMMERSAEA
jgi:excisionase family DNA binding protein